jgi:succinylglutamate desuccinylase
VLGRAAVALPGPAPVLSAEPEVRGRGESPRLLAPVVPRMVRGEAPGRSKRASMTRVSVPALVDSFLAAARPGPFEYEACHHVAGRRSDAPWLVFGFAIHGNEHGSLPALLRLQRELEDGGQEAHVTLLLGNIDAIEKDVRFVEEDFNRVFTFDQPAKSCERKRAERVRPILDRADFFLDFHQTQTKTREPFYTFPWARELVTWARVLGLAEVGLTRPMGQSFSPGLKCLDEYVRDRGKIGLTIETGYRGQDVAQAELVYRGARRAIDAWNRLVSGIALDDIVATAPPIRWYQTEHVIASAGQELRLRAGLENWTEVRAGELLSAAGSRELTSPATGYVLFPKYFGPDESPPPELARIAVPFQSS